MNLWVEESKMSRDQVGISSTHDIASKSDNWQLPARPVWSNNNNFSLQSISCKHILSDISPIMPAFCYYSHRILSRHFTFNLLISLDLKRTYTGS